MAVVKEIICAKASRREHGVFRELKAVHHEVFSNVAITTYGTFCAVFKT